MRVCPSNQGAEDLISIELKIYEKKWQPFKYSGVLLMVAQFFQNCVGFKIFLAGLQKRGFDVNPLFFVPIFRKM
jgi:hypothetical protein